MRPVRLLLAVLALALPTHAFAQAPKPLPDVLVFTNGDRLTGKLEKAAGGSVVFKSDMAGEITVPFDKVKELTSSGSFVEIAKVPMKRPETVTGVVAVNDGSMVVTPASALPKTIPVKDVGYLVDQASYEKQISGERSFFHDWNGTVTGGATIVRSTQTATTLTGSIALVRAMPAAPYLPGHSRTTVNLAESYGKQSTPVIPPTTPASASAVVKTDIFHADAEQDEYFSPKAYALGDVAFDHNFSQGLALQQIYGGGLGWTVVKTAKQSLDVKADLHYEMQAYIASAPGTAQTSSVKLFGSTFSEAYLRNLPRKMIFTETANYIPGWTDTKAYAANATAGLAIPVFKRLNASVSAIDNFLNDPAPFYKKNSFQFITGVTYNLR